MAISQQIQRNKHISPNTPIERINRVFEAQQLNKQRTKLSTPKERVNKIRKLLKSILKHRQAIKDAIYNDFKKSNAEVDLTEIYMAVQECKHVIANLEDWVKAEHIEGNLVYIGTSSEVIYEPKGCCLIISPWNYPFTLSIIPLITAIAAGNTVMMKPSEYTPHTSACMNDILSSIFPEDEVAIIEGDHSVAAELLRLNYDHIFFTGSTAVGKIIMRAASENLTSVTLELGGKTPVIVDETANIKKAAERIAWGKCLNNGQTCISPDYVLVHSTKRDAFIREYVKYIDKAYGSTAEAIKASPDLCRIIDNRHLHRLSNLLSDALDKGAKLEFGGEIDENDNYMAPTILTKPHFESDIMQEEIFGPILPVITFTELSEALSVINSKEKPLALYIFSKNKKNTRRVLDHTSAGGTCINQTMLHYSQPNLMFGGVNHSGIGRAHGIWGFREFSNSRAILKQNLPVSTAELTYPPYNNFVKRIVEILVRWL